MTGTSRDAGAFATLLAALVLAAGCGTPPSAIGTGAGTPFAARRYTSTAVPHVALAGVEVGMCLVRQDDFRKLIDDGVCFGVRYSQELGLNFACSLSAGYYRADGKDGRDDLESFPFRATLELGTHLGPTLSRWYLGGGGGYNLMEEYPSGDDEALWPVDVGHLQSEPTAHAVFGLEFRNETFVATRVEGGYTRLLDSGVDLWTATATLAFQF